MLPSIAETKEKVQYDLAGFDSTQQAKAECRDYHRSSQEQYSAQTQDIAKSTAVVTRPLESAKFLALENRCPTPSHKHGQRVSGETAK